MSAKILRQCVIARLRAPLRVRTVLAVAIAGAFALSLSTAARAATITVNSLADPGATGICALRDAITAADTLTATNGCAAGTGNDTIQFSVSGTITLASTLPQITHRLRISGPVSTSITINGNGFGGGQVMQVASGATLHLKYLTIANGATVFGGGIFNSGTLTVTKSAVSGNFGLAQGGGIFNQGTLRIANSTVFGNEAQGGGGGIENDGTLVVIDSTFSSNGGGDGAAGILNDDGGTLTITNSTFFDNTSSHGAGAIANAGTLTITNSTFSGNRCMHDCSAGVENGGTLTVTNSTFSGNMGSPGGVDNGGSASLKNTILAGSMLAPPPFGRGENCSGSLKTDAGYNISDDSTCGFAKTGSANNGDGVDPLLSTDGLADNGGPTETIALASGSPAIDAIPVADCTDQASPAKRVSVDQRGLPRPDAGEDVCDIGAYESQETFAGLPGAANCRGVSVSALALQFGFIDAAASALGFPSVKALQKAIRAFCGG